MPPSIILPEETGMYKIVQFADPNGFYMRFSEYEMHMDRHVNIVKKFAKEINVEPIAHEGVFTEIYFLPEGAPKIVGAGLCDVSYTYNKLIFMGDSPDYDKTLNIAHIKQLETELTDWKFKYPQ